MRVLGAPPTIIDDLERRQLLARVYALLIRLADEKDNALSGNFGEETEKAPEQTSTQVVACNG